MRPYRYTQIIGITVLPLLVIFAPMLWWVALFPIVLYLHVLAIGSIFIRLNFFVPALHHGERSSRQIALSFDDGPADYTAHILDILKAEGVPAAFFTIGERAAANPVLVQRWAAEDHIVGNHSYRHGFWFDLLPSHKVLKELRATNAVVRHITGHKPRLFRPPYGVTNPAIARAIRPVKMTVIGWSLRSFDTKAKSPEALTAKVCSQLKGGDVILLHDSMEVTAKALTSIICTARQAGFTFVRLDELLNIQPYA